MSDRVGRVDVRGRYDTYPTATGTLGECRDCGALVGDKRRHDGWHQDTERNESQ